MHSIKLTADGAKDYKNALKECSAATKENYSELKLAQSQYDKNTSSTKKLEDRQNYLAKQTDVYKDKVKILNTQLREMETAVVDSAIQELYCDIDRIFRKCTSIKEIPAYALVKSLFAAPQPKEFPLGRIAFHIREQR